MLQKTKIALGVQQTGALRIHQGKTTRTDLTSEAGTGNVVAENSEVEETLEAEAISEAAVISEEEAIVVVAAVVVALTITKVSEDAMTTVRKITTPLGLHHKSQETTLGLKPEQRQLEDGAQRKPSLKMILRLLAMPGAKPKQRTRIQAEVGAKMMLSQTKQILTFGAQINKSRYQAVEVGVLKKHNLYSHKQMVAGVNLTRKIKKTQK